MDEEALDIDCITIRGPFHSSTEGEEKNQQCKRSAHKKRLVSMLIANLL
jgi:hypothetical protein